MMVTGMRSMTSTSGVNRMMRISFIIWITRMVKSRVATCRVTGMTEMAGLMVTGVTRISRMTRMTYWVYWEDLVDWNGLKTNHAFI